MKKKVLVCGASGFIGRNVFERLSQWSDMEVFGTYKSRFWRNRKLLYCDLTHKESVQKALEGMDVVIHAATVTDGLGAIMANPDRYIADNIIMNTLIADTVRANGISQLISLGSSVVYPSKPTPQKETEADLSGIHPQYFMGARIKVSMEDLCRYYSQRWSTRFTMIRPANMYGPYDKFDLQRGHVFAATITKVLLANAGDDIVIWGEGKEERDVLYISDLVDFIETAVRSNCESQYDVFNVSSGVAISVSDLVKKIIEISGKKVGIRYDSAKPSLGNQITLDWQKAYTILAWRPKVDLNQGICQTIDWYLKNKMGENQSGK